MKALLKPVTNWLTTLGDALFFLGHAVSLILRGRIRMGDVLKQMFEQGVMSVGIVAMTSLAAGVVLAWQGYVMMSRFGTKEYVAQLVALTLVRELSPVFTALIFSGKAGARMAADLGTMNVNDQIMATKTLGVDPMEFLVVPRMLACFLVLPILTVVSELVGIFGGYCVGVFDANVPSAFYIRQTLRSIGYVDFSSGLIKVVFFSVLIGWICCYQGYKTSGGSLGVGRHTTRAVALSYIFVIVSSTLLTKIILTLWG